MKMSPGVAAIIWVWYFIIFLVLRPSSALEDVSRQQEQLHLGDYPTVAYNLNDKTRGYSQFLTELRNRLKATQACDMPVTRAALPAGRAEYVLVDLRVSAQQWVTLALRVDNVYLIAYRVGGEAKGTFFDESDVGEAKSKLFDRSANQPTLRYDSNYGNIEKVGGSRTNLPLGLQELRRRIVAFFGPNRPVTNGAEEARFLLTTIQMVSEAARFKYIENLVVRNGVSASFRPDAKMIDLQNNWGKISRAVHNSSKQLPNQCIPIRPPIVIAGETWTLVSDVKMDVILLLHDSSSSNANTRTPVWSSDQLFSNNIVAS